MPALVIISLFALVIIGQVDPRWLLVFGAAATLIMALLWLFSTYQIYIAPR